MWPESGMNYAIETKGKKISGQNKSVHSVKRSTFFEDLSADLRYHTTVHHYSQYGSYFRATSTLFDLLEHKFWTQLFLGKNSDDGKVFILASQLLMRNGNLEAFYSFIDNIDEEEGDIALREINSSTIQLD